ncbi:MAG: serine protease [Alphaproteobacteria bacterium]|nr:serine protease [Alphaproteobacteria bacterium]
MIEPILFVATVVRTQFRGAGLTNATGFFFERGGRLFLVSSRHVFFDAAADHQPDAVTIDLHVDPRNATRTVGFTIPLYRDGKAVWRQGEDSGGEIDVAVIELDRSALPDPVVLRALRPADLAGDDEAPEVGTPLLIPGFPLGFHDQLHHLPVVRHAIIASSFGMRFGGEGYFLTDARTHRGSSGAPVVMRLPQNERGGEDGAETETGFKLLGIHSARFDVGSREIGVDEALGLNCAWYADILMVLTEQG